MFRNKGQSPDNAGMGGDTRGAGQSAEGGQSQRTPAEVTCTSKSGGVLANSTLLVFVRLNGGLKSSCTKGMSRDAMAIRLDPFSASQGSIVDIGNRGVGAEES